MITSMMDMFTIILVFLLNFFDPRTQAESALELPPSASAEEVDKGVILTVSRDAVSVSGQRVLVLNDGQLPQDVTREGRRIEAVFLSLSRAREAVGETAPPLVVQCDRNTSFALLGDILYSAGVAGWSQYRFVVVNDAD
jgi:biopolymer transport protein ExbD